MFVKFFEDEATVLCCEGVDDVVDAGFWNDEGVAVTLAFRAFCVRWEWVLTAIVRGFIADDVGMLTLAEDEVGGIVDVVFLGRELVQG